MSEAAQGVIRDPSWDALSQLKQLEEDPSMDGHAENPLDAATRVFQDHLVLASRSICHMALYAENERLRLDAAKYVVDRNLGRIGEANPLTRQKDPLMDLLEGITTGEGPAN
jgi:hypothetical protein